ncbi:hypothetical protein [Blastopirellula marina]|uniref:Leucine-rich repeat domain-containing protein n=1 Tax=Blastopirellula marina TaxID=124 RepID=A0A2S8GK28_9BACT|nr:hypothetical protein [Blastopirellula marina]PQO44786.1 hypothetical protein C5Y93_16950 [Blastopirellula marina]
MNDTPKSEPTKPAFSEQSFRLRWSLRVLLGVITLACVLFAWGSYQYHLGKVHQDVGQRLESLFEAKQAEDEYWTGYVDVKWTLRKTKPIPVVLSGHASQGARPTRRPDAPIVLADVPNWMKWSGSSLALERIRSILIVSSDSAELLDETVEQIKRLDQIESLEIQSVPITAAQLSQILSHVEIKSLQARWIPESLETIPGMRNSSLERLNLSHTRFSDSATADLPATLIDLNLERTAVTDAAFDQFVRLKKLKGLNLKRTPTSQAGIEALRAKMPWCTIEWEAL